jgi:hypothetical protein
MNKKSGPEKNADFQRKPFREPLESSKSGAEEQDMYAVFDASPQTTPQHSVSLFGWALAFVTGAFLWMLIFYFA